MKRKEEKRDLQREQKHNVIQDKRKELKVQMDKKEQKTGLNNDTMSRMKAAPKVYKKENLCVLSTNTKIVARNSLQYFSGKTEPKGICSTELWQRHKIVTRLL